MLLRVTFLGVALVLTLGAFMNQPRLTEATGSPAFDGRALLGVSDADMIASAYADGRLGRIDGMTDTLTVVPLPLDPARPGITTLPAPNSVISWPQVVDVSPDGRFAYVVETRGTPPADVNQMESVYRDFPEGTRLSVYDVSDPRRPSLQSEYELPVNPNTVMVSGDGKRLAVATDDPSAELVIIDLQDGRPSKIFPHDASAPRDRFGRGGIRSIALHPSGKLLAANILNQRIAFYRIESNPDGIVSDLDPVGEPLEVGNHLAEIQFSKDGTFLIATDVKWSTFGDYTTLNYLLNPRGELTSIQWDEEGDHRIIDRVTVGHSPEGFDIAPQGDIIVTAEMNRTYLPVGFPTNIWPGNDYSSLSLVAFDPNSGKFAYIDQYDFAGILPEDVAFDKSGDNVAVAIYQPDKGENGTPRHGYIGFWNVDRAGPQPRLKQTGFTIQVTRGLHDLVTIP